MNEHDEIRAHLLLHRTGDLDPAAEERLFVHLESCEGCRRELAEIDAALGALRAIDEAGRPLPAALEGLPVLPGVATRRSRFAAAAAIFATGWVAGLLAGWMAMNTDGGPARPQDLPAAIAAPRWSGESGLHRTYGISRALLALKAAEGEGR